MNKLKKERSDGADAFIPESAQVSGTSDDLAENLAEEYLRAASGDDSDEGAGDEEVPEELGGPFVETSAEVEFGSTREGRIDDDARADAIEPIPTRPTRNPLPQAVGPLAIAAPDEDVDGEESPSSTVLKR